MPIGGIVGGVIGAIVVIAAMAIFALYKLNANRKNVAAPIHSDGERGRYYPTENQDYVEKPNLNAHEQSDEMPGAPALRYSTDMEPVSGNVSGNY